MITIDDPHLPGLSGLTPDVLQRITGAEDVSLMRFRYRAGKRAILHLDTGKTQGSVWFFHGDKARRLAKRTSAASYDTASEALYETFPNDHRMPQIRIFLNEYRARAPHLVGGNPIGQPELLRYRPGLSCTLRCHVAGRRAAYVKLINDDSPARLAVMNRNITGLLAGSPVSVAPVIETDPELSAISYAEARGRPLDAELAATNSIDPALQGIDALRRFWRLPFTPTRHLSAEVLTRRASESTTLVALTAPQSLSAALRVLTRVETRTPSLGCRPIHGDMKLEHLFLDGGRTTLIDTESVSLGPPDYDLAQLYGRLWQADLEGHLPRALVIKAAGEIRRAGRHSFDWCRDVVALRLAKFYAQRPSPEAAKKITGILERLE